ncbi:MAG: Lrp/AsnC family transcriptional regulator, partial [Hyphomicrobiales bacterium]|nr:Lrp/AsnC family transcriptional regulator [Hyphomicrobiales bacterium]
MALNDMQLRLIDRWQRGFPLEPAPFECLARELELSELMVLGLLKQLIRDGALSRVGAVVAPNTAGASTLAAMAVPPARLEEVAEYVSAEPSINHNYAREHHFNLWFVVTGADRAGVRAALMRIERGTGLPVIDLPLHTAYHIDLGFPLSGSPQRATTRRTGNGISGATPTVTDADRKLLQEIEDGIPISPRPFAVLGRRTGASEKAVITRLKKLVGNNVIRRFGLIVRHHELGYNANAMVVWDIADSDVDRVGAMFAKIPFVTLCYRRDRR